MEEVCCSKAFVPFDSFASENPSQNFLPVKLLCDNRHLNKRKKRKEISTIILGRLLMLGQSI